MYSAVSLGEVGTSIHRNPGDLSLATAVPRACWGARICVEWGIRLSVDLAHDDIERADDRRDIGQQKTFREWCCDGEVAEAGALGPCPERLAAAVPTR